MNELIELLKEKLCLEEIIKGQNGKFRSFISSDKNYRLTFQINNSKFFLYIFQKSKYVKVFEGNIQTKQQINILLEIFKGR